MENLVGAEAEQRASTNTWVAGNALRAEKQAQIAEQRTTDPRYTGRPQATYLEPSQATCVDQEPAINNDDLPSEIEFDFG